MELSEDFIKTNGLTPEQATAVTGFSTAHIADLKKGWDTKANDNAQGILNGAATKLSEVTGIKKDEGEKIADYLTRSANEFLTTSKAALETAKTEYETKAKDVKGAEHIKADYEALQAKQDGLLQIEAKYNEIKDIPDLYATLKAENQATKLESAFAKITPALNKDTDPYSFSGRWNEQKAKVLQEWDISIVDGTAMAKSKKNEYTTKPLKELMYTETITKFLEGRQQEGTGAKTVVTSKLDGVPFDVPVEAVTNSKIRLEIITKYLATKGIGTQHPSFTPELQVYNNKIRENKAA